MKYLTESSIEELYSSTVRAFPNTTMRQHATQPIVLDSMNLLPFVGMKTLFVKGQARNEDRHYNTILLFKNVDFNKDDVVITGSDGLTYRFGKLSLENTDILTRCNCPDFHWRFNYYNHLDKSLYGNKRTKYENKGIGPPANPKEMPGMCKHLIKTIEILTNSGLFLN